MGNPALPQSSVSWHSGNQAYHHNGNCRQRDWSSHNPPNNEFSEAYLPQTDRVVRKLNIDMYRTYLAMHTVDNRFVHQPFAIPCLLLIGYNRKIHTPVDHRPKDIGLWQGLSILLSDPGFRSISRNHDDRQFLIKTPRRLPDRD